MAIQTLNTIKTWFKTGLKPSQAQFWDTWDSFRHKYEKVPLKEVEELETILSEKAEKSQLNEHITNEHAHAELFIEKEDKNNKGIANGYVPLDEFAKITAQYLTIVNDLATGGISSLLSAQQGVVLQSKIESINQLLASDNINLNTIQKIVDAIEQVQISLNTILVNDLTTGGVTKALTAEMGKLLKTSKEDKSQKGLAGGYAPLDQFSKIAHQYLSIVNNLTAGGTTSMLSAEQGVILQDQIDGINILLSSDDDNLDTIQKIVDAINGIESYLDTILVNDLTTGGSTKALTAEMGKLLETNKEDKYQKGEADGYAPLNSFTKLASEYLDIVNDLVSGGSASLLSAEQGVILQNQIDGINTVLSSDDINLDTVQEIVDAIKGVESYLATILVNNLTAGGTTKALTAEMGKLLNEIKLTATIATDAETQISASVTEDNKVISRSKLFNWWKSIQSQILHVSGNENFSGVKSSINVGNTSINGISLSNHGTTGTTSLGIINTNTGRGALVINNGKIGLATFNNSNGTGIYSENRSTGVLASLDSVEGSTGDLMQFLKDSVLTSKFDYNGVLTVPYVILQISNLLTVPVNGAIERDLNGQLWETHSGVRSRLITTSDGVILIAFKQPSNIQINITGSISATATNTSYNTIIGKIGNNSVLRLNALNEVYYPSPLGTIAPTIAKSEVFLKINNGLFATNWNGSNSTNQVKIMEFSGLNNNGFKNYQNPIMTNIQNSDPLIAQWSTIQLVVQTINNGVLSNADATYYLRNADNTRTFGASEASFSFVFKNTATYTDATNANGQNTDRIIRLNNYALYIETIR